MLGATESPELVRAEVVGAVRDRPREERLRDAKDRVGHFADELFRAALGKQGLRMFAFERVGDHELRAQEAHTIDGQRRRFLGCVCHGEVDVEARRQRL